MIARLALALLLTLVTVPLLRAADPLPVWPDLAPGEKTKLDGEAQPPREGEDPPITRVVGISRPTLTVHLAPEPNGAGVVILPGGGFAKVVPDMEGTEAADWLNAHGFAAFVLSYRTKNSPEESGWEKALQDAQRTLSLIRSHAADYQLEPNRIGLLGFSAGGQVATRLLSSPDHRAYDPIDAVDKVSFRPDFAVLIYPWNIYDPKSDGLIEGVSVPESCPPTFLVHTDDDRSSSLGAVLFYAGLKRHGIPAEIHVYGNGGHGYGLRKREGSQIDSWPGHAAHWLDRWIQGKR
ncbi:MAG: alpha/beta hydrolase [Verrucomicrobiae bacterium]|nr:alpha/beta hydrolase [Verrucomicrobiae bacterium]